MITSDKRFFASYAREDHALVEPVLALLREANPGAFLDLDETFPPNRWPERVDAALTEASTFVIFWSHRAAQAETVKGEWQSAIPAGKEIVTVLLDATPLPEPLKTVPSADFQDLTTAKNFSITQRVALLSGIVLLLGAAAIPLIGWKLGILPPTTAPVSASKTSPTSTSPEAPAATPAPSGDREGHLRDLLSKGRQLRESGDSTAALTQFQEAAALDENNPVSFVELAVTEEAMGQTSESIEHWRKVYAMGTSAGLYFSLAEAKLRAANALTPPAEAAPVPEESPDLTAPVEGIASGSLIGLLPIKREDQLDGKSAARFVLHIPLKVRPKAHIDVHALVIHVLFYEMVDGRRIEETAANVKSHWLNPPADWVGSQTEQLDVEYQLPKPPSAADVIVDRKYYGYIVRVYYKELLQVAVAEPASLAKLHPAPPTVTGEPIKPPAPKQTPAPLPQGAFHQSAPVGLSAPATVAAATPSPTLPPDDLPASTPPPIASVETAASAASAWISTPLPWILSSAVLACLAIVGFVSSRVARRRHGLLDTMLVELAARRLAAALAEQPSEGEPEVIEEISDIVVEEPQEESAPPPPSENLAPVPEDSKGEQTDEPRS